MFKDCSDIDTAIVTLKYPGGTVACIELSKEADIGCFYHRLEVGFFRLLIISNKPLETFRKLVISSL